MGASWLAHSEARQLKRTYFLGAPAIFVGAEARVMPIAQH